MQPSDPAKAPARLRDLVTSLVRPGDLKKMSAHPHDLSMPSLQLDNLTNATARLNDRETSSVHPSNLAKVFQDAL